LILIGAKDKNTTLFTDSDDVILFCPFICVGVASQKMCLAIATFDQVKTKCHPLVVIKFRQEDRCVVPLTIPCFEVLLECQHVTTSIAIEALPPLDYPVKGIACTIILVGILCRGFFHGTIWHLLNGESIDLSCITGRSGATGSGGRVFEGRL
jgi:hypothetical protein